MSLIMRDCYPCPSHQFLTQAFVDLAQELICGHLVPEENLLSLHRALGIPGNNTQPRPLEWSVCDHEVTPLISTHLQFKCGCEDSGHRSAPALLVGLSGRWGFRQLFPKEDLQQ